MLNAIDGIAAIVGCNSQITTTKAIKQRLHEVRSAARTAFQMPCCRYSCCLVLVAQVALNLSNQEQHKLTILGLVIVAMLKKSFMLL
jgi:hypothetical protein